MIPPRIKTAPTLWQRVREAFGVYGLYRAHHARPYALRAAWEAWLGLPF